MRGEGNVRKNKVWLKCGMVNGWRGFWDLYVRGNGGNESDETGAELEFMMDGRGLGNGKGKQYMRKTLEKL